MATRIKKITPIDIVNANLRDIYQDVLADMRNEYIKIQNCLTLSGDANHFYSAAVTAKRYPKEGVENFYLSTEMTIVKFMPQTPTCSMLYMRALLQSIYRAKTVVVSKDSKLTIDLNRYHLILTDYINEQDMSVAFRVKKDKVNYKLPKLLAQLLTTLKAVQVDPDLYELPNGGNAQELLADYLVTTTNKVTYFYRIENTLLEMSLIKINGKPHCEIRVL